MDGIKFPSELERNVYLCLKHLKTNGVISHFHRQVIFDLPGGYKHLVDFMAITAVDHRIIYIESKGMDLAVGRLKRRQAEELYGIIVHLITAPNQIASLFHQNKQLP